MSQQFDSYSTITENPNKQSSIQNIKSLIFDQENDIEIEPIREKRSTTIDILNHHVEEQKIKQEEKEAKS